MFPASVGMDETEDHNAGEEGKFSGFVLDPEKCSQLTLTEKRELVHEIAQWPEDAPRILSSFTRRELLEIICAEMGKERKYTGHTKSRMIGNLLNLVSVQKKKKKKDMDNAIDFLPVQSHPATKRQKRDENLNQPSVDEQVKSVLCGNLACRATLHPKDGFCRRCSCCICRCYDDNKDPSLWLTCDSDPPYAGDSCGLSCHLKCALKLERAASIKKGCFRKLDGEFCCVACGKVNDLMSTWRKLLLVAKEARRVDVLCLRIYLCCKILDGTERYKDLHKLVEAAAKKLRNELGPLDRVCAKMGRGIVNRLTCGTEVQKLCTIALEACPKFSTSSCTLHENRPPLAACKILFEESNSTSVVIVLEYEEHLNEEGFMGFQIWHRESSFKSYPEKPTCMVLKPEKRFRIFDLKPSTEYVCRVSMFSCIQICGTWEAKWVTCPSSSSISDSNEEHGISTINLPNPALPFVNPASIPVTPSKVDGKSRSEGPDFECCVRVIKSLEYEGHLSPDFRVKFLTWYSLKATKQERRVVSAFVDAMASDPPSLAEQLIDTFADEICTKSWP